MDTIWSIQIVPAQNVASCEEESAFNKPTHIMASQFLAAY